MSEEQNLEATKKLGEAVSTGDLQALKEIFSADVIDHDPAPDQGRDPEGFIKFFTMQASPHYQLHAPGSVQSFPRKCAQA